jgi:hypothetical protein
VKVDVFMLEFREQGGMFIPKDPELHKLAVRYAEQNLAQKVNFTEFRNVWVTCEVNSVQRPVRVLGLLGMVMKADFPLVRFTDNSAPVKSVTRARSYLQDNFSARGQEAFIYIADKEDDSQRCPRWERWLTVFGCEKAERYRITI